jgi:hypothetical protein
MANGAIAIPSGDTAAASTSGPTAFSETNNQVAGVDEADFIKTDGQYLYVAANGALRIMDSWPPEESREVSRLELPGEARKLFVFQDRALVYSALAPSSTTASPECTYGYGCSFTGDGSRTVITVVDLADRAHPSVLRSLELSGSLLAARRIDGVVHTVVHDAVPRIADYPVSPANVGSGPDEAIAAFVALRDQNAEKIRQTGVDLTLPSVTETVYADAAPVSTVRLGDGVFRVAPGADGRSFITVLSLDLTAATGGRFVSVASHPGAAYASANAIYLSVPMRQSTPYSGLSDPAEASLVHKFALEGAAAQYVASGVVDGHVLNQFALDEYEGNLRVATSSGYVPSSSVHSQVTVLEQAGTVLHKVGELDQLAPLEDIRSVRFDGPRAFVVTFKKTDPLFVIGLADPAQPAVLGELMIPGFSTYMHLLDSGHLLTIGFDAADQGSFAWFQGIMLQIFDVTDMTNPLLLHKEVIGTRGSSSAAATNHLAFTYFAPLGVLGLPINVCDGTAGTSAFGTLTFSGLMVYDVSVETGFRLRGRVAHPWPVSAADALTYGTSDPSYYACSDWWTDSSSVVERSIFMDAYVFSASHQLIKVNQLDQLETDLASLRLLP